MKTRLFTRDDVADVVGHVGLHTLMDRIIDGVHDACATFDAAHYQVPVRSGFSYRQPRTGLLEWMPAMQHGGRIVIKLVGYHPHNPTVHGVPTILSTLVVFDADSGHLVSVLDGTLLTSMRTGAASAVASRVLAEPDSSTLGLIGCGAQAVTQFHALSRVFPLTTVMLSDIDEATALSFRERVSGVAPVDTIFEVTTANEAARRADILCTQTSVEIGAGPVFDALDLKPELHVNAVGSDFPGKVEVPLPLLERSLVCPDFTEQARDEGECQQLLHDRIGPDLAELIQNAGRHEASRKGWTVFDSTGWALEDFVAATLLTDLGEECGIGSAVNFETISDDPKNPYDFLSGAALPHAIRSLLGKAAGSG